MMQNVYDGKVSFKAKVKRPLVNDNVERNGNDAKHLESVVRTAVGQVGLLVVSKSHPPQHVAET